jgi:hypothetical protein
MSHHIIHQDDLHKLYILGITTLGDIAAYTSAAKSWQPTAFILKHFPALAIFVSHNSYDQDSVGARSSVSVLRVDNTLYNTAVTQKVTVCFCVFESWILQIFSFPVLLLDSLIQAFLVNYNLKLYLQILWF